MIKLILAFFFPTCLLYILHTHPMIEQWEEQYRLLSRAYRLAYTIHITYPCRLPYLNDDDDVCEVLIRPLCHNERLYFFHNFQLFFLIESRMKKRLSAIRLECFILYIIFYL